MKINEMSKQQQPYARFVNFYSGIFRKRAFVFTLAALICCAGVAIVVRGYNTKAPAPEEARSSAGIPVAVATSIQGFTQGQRPTSVHEARLITITPDHIQPAEITSSEGIFILAYENRSGLENISLRLTFKERFIHQVDMPLLSTMWAGEFNLGKGTYELRESSHPDWVCTITVQ